MRISVRDTTQANNVSMQAISFNGLNTTTASFGYTVDSTTTPGEPVLTAWMKTPGETNQITVTSLSENTTQLAGNVVQVDAEPAGMVYSTVDEFATLSQVSSMVNSMNAAFTAFSSSMASGS